MRAVLDPNILIASLLSRSGAPGELVARGLAGDFEIIVSEALIAELERALGYPKLLKRVSPEEAVDFVGALRRVATVVPDPSFVPPRSSEAGDDYLIALAEDARAFLVSGDGDLLALSEEIPVRTARAFLESLRS